MALKSARVAAAQSFLALLVAKAQRELRCFLLGLPQRSSMAFTLRSMIPRGAQLMQRLLPKLCCKGGRRMLSAAKRQRPSHALLCKRHPRHALLRLKDVGRTRHLTVRRSHRLLQAMPPRRPKQKAPAKFRRCAANASQAWSSQNNPCFLRSNRHDQPKGP